MTDHEYRKIQDSDRVSERVKLFVKAIRHYDVSVSKIITMRLYDAAPEIRQQAGRVFGSKRLLFETQSGKPYQRQYVSDQIAKSCKRVVGRRISAHFVRPALVKRTNHKPANHVLAYKRALDKKEFFCRVCGYRPPQGYETTINVHHLVPKCVGGRDEESNYILICENCHRIAHSAIKYPKSNTVNHRRDYPETKDSFVRFIREVLSANSPND